MVTPSWFVIKAFIRHWLEAVDDHSIHSPFFFEFYNKLVKERPEVWGSDEVERVRERMLKNSFPIEIQELGSGSEILTGSKEKLLDVARTSLTPVRYAGLYSNMIRYFQLENVVELGTSLGITTLYLALREDSKVFTFEGSKSAAGIALTNFEFFEKKNIRLIEGNIDQTLNDFLQDPRKIHFVLIDANHRYEPTIRYFRQLLKRLYERSIVVLDDIHRSDEMEQAWKELKASELIYGSVDLFRCGILFFDPSLNRQHFTWEYR